MHGVRPGEEPFTITLELGKPYLWKTSPDTWACPIALKGLYDRLADMRGEDALQALCLALRLAFELLDDFRQKGGKLTYETGEDVPIEAYGFCIVRR